MEDLKVELRYTCLSELKFAKIREASRKSEQQVARVPGVSWMWEANRRACVPAAEWVDGDDGAVENDQTV